MGMKHRFKAFATHFGLSALVLAGCMAVIFGLWYPHPYYRILGAEHILLSILRTDDVGARDVMAAQVDPDELRRKILELLDRAA